MSKELQLKDIQFFVDVTPKPLWLLPEQCNSGCIVRIDPTEVPKLIEFLQKHYPQDEKK